MPDAREFRDPTSPDSHSLPCGTKVDTQADIQALRTQLLRIAANYSGRAVTAEDIVQEAFVVLVRHLREGRPIESLDAWLSGVTRNVAREIHRKRTRRSALFREYAKAALGDAESDTESHWRSDAVWHAASTLPESQKRIVRSMLKGHSDVEISAELRLPKATVRVYRHRAIAQIRAVLDPPQK